MHQNIVKLNIYLMLSKIDGELSIINSKYIFYLSKLLTMTTISKNYGFPTGYFSLIYNYLCDTGKIDRNND